MDKETERYFYGPSEEELEPKYEPGDFEATIQNESEEQLRRREQELKLQIREDIEKEKLKNEHLSLVGRIEIEKDALPDEIRNSEKLHKIHESQYKIVTEKLNKRKAA